MRRRRGQNEAGSLFPGFTEVVEIGRSGFSTVYRAVEAETSRPVALKALHLADAGRAVAEMFDDEIRALAAVSSHPHIVTLYRSAAATDGRPVLVLELCEGSLAQRVRASGPLAPFETVATGIKIAGALETAHRAGYLHRDLKPQNLLVTRYGEPALSDFGVAALQARAQGSEGVFGFTTLHAPPEVLEGRELSPATDVYGLASTLYQLVSGRAPFVSMEGEAPASLILRILRDPVAPLLSPEVPLTLSDLLAASLAKRAEDRPPTAAAFAEQLSAIASAEGWPPTSFVVLGAPGDLATGPIQRPPLPTHPPAPAAEAAPPADEPIPPPPTAGGAPPLSAEPGSPLPAAREPSLVAPVVAERRVVEPIALPVGEDAADRREGPPVEAPPPAQVAPVGDPPSSRPAGAADGAPSTAPRGHTASVPGEPYVEEGERLSEDEPTRPPAGLFPPRDPSPADEPIGRPRSRWPWRSGNRPSARATRGRAT